MSGESGRARGRGRANELGAVPQIGKAYGMETIRDDSLMAQPEVYFEGDDHETLVRVKTSAHMPFSAPMHEDGPRRLF
jgi:hypothetical protein